MKCSVNDTRDDSIDDCIFSNLNNELDTILSWVTFILFLLSICFSTSLPTFSAIGYHTFQAFQNTSISVHRP